jgi:hypothetical protein
MYVGMGGRKWARNRGNQLEMFWQGDYAIHIMAKSVIKYVMEKITSIAKYMRTLASGFPMENAPVARYDTRVLKRLRSSWPNQEKNSTSLSQLLKAEVYVWALAAGLLIFACCLGAHKYYERIKYGFKRNRS